MRYYNVRQNAELQSSLRDQVARIARIASFLGLIVGAVLVYLAHEAIGA
jgi:hypothetical protein